MLHRLNTGISARSVATTTLAASLLGCTQATRVGVETSKPTFASAGAILSNISNGARGLFESQTLSLALDRIDQRVLPLDRTYRRIGTGRGVTVYVFDGG